jgi:hypothetical protein
VTDTTTTIHEQVDHGQADVSIDDHDDLHRVRRVEAIHDARERFVKVRLQAMHKMYEQSAFFQRDVDKYANMTALDYLRELEPMIRRSDSDFLDRIIVIGSQRFSPDNIRTSEQNRDVMWDESTLITKPVRVTVQELLNKGARVKSTATAHGTRVGHTDWQEEVEIYVQPDASVATRIVRLCDDFIEDTLPSITESSNTADFDYSDLL